MSSPSRETYQARFATIAPAVEFEERVLSVGAEFLPPCAVEVLNGADGTPQYWAWLIRQHDVFQYRYE